VQSRVHPHARPVNGRAIIYEGRLYELRPEPLREIDAWLAPYRRLWAQRPDALERHLDTMPDTE
jgi:hypothetical protein